MAAQRSITTELAHQRFARDGFVVVPALASPARMSALCALVETHLAPLIGPAEFEADIHYPGAPASREAIGGETPRRLLSAIARGDDFRAWALDDKLRSHVEALLGGQACVAQGHHNCVMTKFPGHSSATLWHQDIRYWSFDRPELVSVWLALGEERTENGALRMLPGSHRLELDRGRLDAELFLRPEIEANKALIDSAVSVQLAPGDAVFFDARTFHAAGRNQTDAVKLSLVYTYHRDDNHPIPGTRSANYPSLPLRP